MKIAIVRLSALGDIVHSMIVLQFIKREFPQSRITWITQSGFTELLEKNPHIDEIVGIDPKKIKKRPLLAVEYAKKLRSLGEFDKIVDLQGLLKSALICRILKGKRYGLEFGSAREWEAALLYEERITVFCEKNVIYRNLDMVSKVFGFEYTKSEVLNKKPLLYFNIEGTEHLKTYFKERENVLIVPGSSQKNKNYPPQKMAEVAKAFKNPLIIWGNESEKKIAKQIASASRATVLPKLSFNQLKYVISRSDMVIGGDTGPTHMAWAMNRPSVVLFGYTPTSLMFQTEINAAVKSPSPAGKCRFDKNDDSIKLIKPETVIEKAKEILERQTLSMAL